MRGERREMCGKDESGKPRSFMLHPGYHFPAVHLRGKFAQFQKMHPATVIGNSIDIAGMKMIYSNK